MTRLVLLAALVLAAGLALGTLARRGFFPRGRSTEVPVAAVPETTIALTWDGTALAPDRLRVPRDTRVTLAVTTTAAAFGGNLAIPDYGYDGPRVPLVPGAVRTVTWITDRPGDGFAITVGGKPAGRLDVTGEHLEEHRR